MRVAPGTERVMLFDVSCRLGRLAIDGAEMIFKADLKTMRQPLFDILYQIVYRFAVPREITLGGNPDENFVEQEHVEFRRRRSPAALGPLRRSRTRRAPRIR
jgi:hypothetical protein